MGQIKPTNLELIVQDNNLTIRFDPAKKAVGTDGHVVAYEMVGEDLRNNSIELPQGDTEHVINGLSNAEYVVSVRGFEFDGSDSTLGPWADMDYATIDYTAPNPPSNGGGSGGGGGGGCFIATASFGTPMADEVKVLSEFRDTHLLTNPVGKLFVATYYKTSPPIAVIIKQHPVLKNMTRKMLRPLIWLAKKVD